MFALRCTKRLLDYLDIRPEPAPPAPTTALGDWYATLAPLEFAGNLIVFVNERSFLTVAIPLQPDMNITNLPALFYARVINLFHMIGVPEADQLRELTEMEGVHFSRVIPY